MSNNDDHHGDALERLVSTLGRIKGAFAWEAITLIFILSEAAWIALLFVLEELQGLIGAAFAHATIAIAISFHIFDVGNTAFSCGASLDDSELMNKGRHITNNGKVMAYGGAFFVGASFLWLFTTNLESTFREASFWGGALSFGLGSLLFITGLYEQGGYSTWYEDATEKIDEG